MKTYKQLYQIAMADKSKLYDQFIQARQESYQRKLALEQCNIPDPIRVANYEKTIDCLKNLYYTMNQARPEWELVSKLLKELGEV